MRALIICADSSKQPLKTEGTPRLIIRRETLMWESIMGWRGGWAHLDPAPVGLRLISSWFLPQVRLRGGVQRRGRELAHAGEVLREDRAVPHHLQRQAAPHQVRVRLRDPRGGLLRAVRGLQNRWVWVREAGRRSRGQPCVLSFCHQMTFPRAEFRDFPGSGSRLSKQPDLDLWYDDP